MIRDGEEIIGVVVGPSKCGKTTLCAALAGSMWRRHGLPSIVFDPFKFKHDWGKTAWVTDDLPTFKRAVLGTRGKAIFWDESSTTLKKTASDDLAFFTQIRHRHKAFFLIGHDFTIISPMMRANLSDAYVFRQGEDRPKLWSGLFADADMMQTGDLKKREFIHKRPFEKIVRRCPSLDELARL